MCVRINYLLASAEDEDYQIEVRVLPKSGPRLKFARIERLSSFLVRHIIVVDDHDAQHSLSPLRYYATLYNNTI